MDLKDLDVSRITELGAGSRRWVATGKHLCGAATDYALRACFGSAAALPSDTGGASVAAPAAAAAEKHSIGALENDAMSGDAAGANKLRKTHEAQSCGSGGGAAALAALSPAAETLSEAAALAAAGRGTAPGLAGAAIATCCHDRCGWTAYVGKRLFRQLDLSPADFELISWMTGAAAAFIQGFCLALK